MDKIFAWPVLLYRKHKFGYSYRRIPLGEGRFTLVDPSDFYLLNEFNWHLNGFNGKFYAVRSAIIDDSWTATVRMHREIMQAPEDRFVDHRNGNGLDNRRDNLRIATRAQNMQNRKSINKNLTSSRFVGVCFRKGRGKWFAQITSNGKRMWLGYFDNEEEAARAYDRAAIKFHGEFARLNFPREDYIDENCQVNSK